MTLFLIISALSAAVGAGIMWGRTLFSDTEFFAGCVSASILSLTAVLLAFASYFVFSHPII